MIFSLTLLIIGITVGISLWAFNDNTILNKLILYPYAMDRPSEYYRLLTSGFIHGDMGHLFFNMFTLYFFGNNMESICGEISYKWVYVFMYLSAIVVASMPAFFKHRRHSNYLALGASGGVSAVLFSFIYYQPWGGLQLMFIPINIPAILFGAIYLLYSYYMSRRGSDNIGHDAHFFGSVYGFVFAFFLDPTHGRLFLIELQHPHLS
jgi:membrane associated rhomboid family serine protease